MMKKVICCDVEIDNGTVWFALIETLTFEHNWKYFLLQVDSYDSLHNFFLKLRVTNVAESLMMLSILF